MVLCSQQILLTFTFIHFDKPPLHKGKKTHTIFFTSRKFHLGFVIGQMLISHPKTIRRIRICAVYNKSSFFPLNLAWSKSQYVYDKPTYMYIHTHFKQFNLYKPFTVSKRATKISSPSLPV